MLSCGAIFTRTGPLNTSTTIGLACKGANMQRNISIITRNKYLKFTLLGTPSQSLSEVQSRVLAPHIIFKCINTTHVRAQYLRKIHTHLLARSSAGTTEDSAKTEIRHISEGESPEDKFGKLRGGVIPNRVFSSENENHEDAPAPKVRQMKYAEIEALYPEPKCKVNQIYQSIESQLKREATCNVEYRNVKKGATNLWQCEYKVTWPEQNTVAATGSTKPGASRAAAFKVLLWLHNSGKIKNGTPVIFDSTEVKDMLNKPTPLTVKPETIVHVEELLETYNAEIKQIITDSHKTHTPQDIMRSNNVHVDPVGRSNGWGITAVSLDRRNRDLQDKFEHRKMHGDEQHLPIFDYREKIIEEIAKSRALLIKGDTGCGKTTQVPQYIMDSYAEMGRATECNMIVSQPRRISAISLAERIAVERREPIGDVVGYQVRLKQVLPQTPAGMLFCTTGILLRKLQSNPSLKGCSHVILDEAHERSINTDMLLVLLKRALQSNPDLKVVVMSATINADLFQHYFDCGVIEVPGRTYPVEMNFLEDIKKIGILPTRHYVGNSEFPEAPFVDCEQIGELISWIADNKPPGAILCFLPGWAEIVKVKKHLEENCRRHHHDMIVPVHSRMSYHDQRKIFQIPPQGKRKIVLATDIAETGITVTDVVYVVDSATQKAMRWHEKKGLATMDNQYASQANILQRKGRAGRVQSGTSYHFVSKAQFESLDVYPLPEVLRNSLEQTVLDCKTYSDEKAMSFLESMPQPPTKSAIEKALYDLSELGALDADENLTPLGKRIALFTVHPKLSKAMVYSSIFQCVAPMVTIASAMSADNEIFSGTLFDKQAIRSVKQTYHPTSDHVSIAWIFAQWAEYMKGGWENAKSFCWKTKLFPERMSTLSKVRDLNAEHLVQCRMINHLDDYANPDSVENEYATLDELVRGVLLAGLDQLIQHRDFDLRKGKLKKGTNVFIMEDGHRATVTPESVNFKKTTFPSPFFTYVRKQHSEERRTSLIRETSMVSPVTAFLFTQARIHGFDISPTAAENKDKTNNKQILLTIKGRKNFKLSADLQLARTLFQLRDSMWKVVRYLVHYQGLVDDSHETDYYKVQDYKTQMLQVLGQLLSEAAEKIDEPEKVSRRTPPSSATESQESDEE